MSKDRANVEYDAPWTENLAHRTEPNRVQTLQTPSPGQFSRPLGELMPPSPATSTAPRMSPQPVSPRFDAQAREAEPSYYDAPMLKPPVWRWQIASYFFLGGLSAGAYVICRAADRFGGRRFARLARVGSYLAMASLLPCPPLLIADLGDPKRFHHMLRVFKPTSPMNLGTWMITAYGGMAAFEVVRQYIGQEGPGLGPDRVGRLRKIMNNGVVLLVHDAAGIPFSLLVASYTGVLLSCTSNPLWCKNPWLSPLFTASAMSNGAEALSLVLDCCTAGDEEEETQELLQRIDTIAHIVELLCMRGFLRHAGEKAKPLTGGRMKKVHALSTGAIIAAEAVKRLPRGRGLEKPARLLAAALGLAGGMAMRWAMVFGGHEAAGDPHLSRVVSRPSGGRG